jgi:hypothetical protein
MKQVASRALLAYLLLPGGFGFSINFLDFEDAGSMFL